MTEDFVVGVASSIFASATVAVAGMAWARRRFLAPSGRRAALLGRWAGRISQTTGSRGVDLPLEIEFRAFWKFLKGTATLDYGRISAHKRSESADLDFRGSFLSEEFVLFNYSNRNAGVRQFGAFVGRLSPTGLELNGLFCGYGPLSQELVGGQVTLKKIH